MATIAGTVAVMQGRWWCPMCGGYGTGGWSMMFMWLFWLVVLAALVWLVARYAGYAGGRGGAGGGAGRGEDNAEAILRERYARGEIDETTYRRMLEELRRGP
jgi:putative membrane protein